MNEIEKRLVVGADLGYDDELMKDNLDALLAMGVTHIVDCRIEWSDKEFVTKHAPQVTYLQAPHDDNGVRAARTGSTRASSSLSMHCPDPDARVYVHCHMGVNRGPSMAFAIMLALGWEPLAAYDRIVEARPEAWVLYATQAYRWWLKREQVPSASDAKVILEQLADRIEAREEHAIRVIQGLRSQEA